MTTQILTRSRTSDILERMEMIRTLIRSLLHEVTLQAQPISIDPEKGIDFYENVARFETHLIVSALEISGGRQSRAARLLNMRASTLNSKMKQLNIKIAR